MKFIPIILTIIFIFSACNKNITKPKYTSKSYTNINKDAILNAAKTVLKLSDEMYNISSGENNIIAKKITTRYFGYNVDLEINTIKVDTIMENNVTDVKLTILQKHDYFDNNTTIITNDTHKLFWDRIEYILGLKKTWSKCFKYTNLINYDGILCDKLYYENNIANKNDIIKEIGIKEKVEQDININNKIEDIKLDDISNIELPNSEINFDSNKTIQEINLDK